MLDRNNVEIRAQVHQMDAEGCHVNEPTEAEIDELLNAEGFEATSIDIWLDTAQGLWRWFLNIEEK